MKILISGAGIAGLTLAHWLHVYGHEVTIIEKRENLQARRGYLIFFWGPGYNVAENMGILPSLKLRDNVIPELIYLNKNGRRVAALAMSDLHNLLDNRVCTFFRGDLEDVLLEKMGDKILIRSGIEIKNIVEEKNKVFVHLSNNLQEEYDLVVGADGIHSTVRKLVFGEENQFLNSMGYHFAVFIHPNHLNLKKSFYAHGVPQKMVAFFPVSEDKQVTFFICKSENKLLSRNMPLLLEQFQGLGWCVPSILESIKSSDELFIDELMQIKMPAWHRNRIVLVGDSCHSLSLMGAQGASLAMSGAYLLATLLHQHHNNFEKAFPAYQQRLKPVIDKQQKAAAKFIRSFVPDTHLGIYSRNYLLNLINIPFIPQLIFKGLLKKHKMGFVS